MQPRLYYTATIITLNDSDTNSHGEPCEAGHGYREVSGWWNPDRSYWTVHTERDNAIPDVCPPRADPVAWLVRRLHARLGDLDSFDGGHTFYGAREAIHPGRLTGVRAQQPGAVLGTRTLLGDALAAGRLRRPHPGQQTLTAAAHAYHLDDGDVYAAAVQLGLVTATITEEER